MVPVSSSRPAILGATILLGAVFTFSAWCAVAAIDPTPRKALQCERHEGVFREAAERSRRNPGPYPPSLCVLPDCRRATDRKGAPNRLAQAFRMPGRIRFQRFAPEARRARLHRGPQHRHRMPSRPRKVGRSSRSLRLSWCVATSMFWSRKGRPRAWRPSKRHGLFRSSWCTSEIPWRAGSSAAWGGREETSPGYRAAQGDCSGDLARRGLDGFYESQPLAGLCRDGSHG